MKKKIENPKVFISYAWGSDEYQNKVLAFVSQLRSDGIDTIFDKWDLTEGNDTYAFMEKCVNDPSVTNVLMLLDPIYAQKADDHFGGVGTETQIISAKVYQEVTQDKFIPVIMERDENGSVCKPTYLQTRLHFDLSLEEDYDNTYQRLVKKLYGEEVYAKPELGKKPSWVDKPIVVSSKSVVANDSSTNLKTVNMKKNPFANFLSNISQRIIDFAQNSNLKYKKYLDLYDSTKSIKSDFLLALNNSPYVEESHKIIARFLEETIYALPVNSSIGCEIMGIFIHELFLYTIAFFIKNKDYTSAGYILSKTYSDQRRHSNISTYDGFNIFNSGSKQKNLDIAVCDHDGIQYYSGTAHYWVSNVNTEFCSKGQFLLADQICFNYSVYGKDYVSEWLWSPVTYIYDNGYNCSISEIAKKMSSRRYLQEILPLFGYDRIDDFITEFRVIENAIRGKYYQFKYIGIKRNSHILGDFIKAEQIASLQ